MSQQTLEILNDEQIAPLLLQSKYPELIASVGSIDSDDSIVSVDSIDSKDLIFPEYSIDSKDLIFPEYSIDSEDLIFPEYSIAPEYSIDSEDLIFPEYSIDSEDLIDSENLIFQEDSIAPREIDIDPLTGMARNRGPWWPGTNNGSQVTALKDARLNIGINYIWGSWNAMRVTATVKVELGSSHEGSSLVLQSSVWGIDNTLFDRRNDLLFYFPDQYISKSGTYTFTTVVNSGKLDEDRWWFDHRDEIQASISVISYSSASPLNLRTHTNIFNGWF